MKRPALRTLAVLISVAGVVVGLAGPTASAEWPAGGLPPCPRAVPEAGGPANPPAALPGETGLGRCRAVPTQVQSAGVGAELPVPRPGYHHLGATTVGGWSGLVGRLTVRDPAVPAGSYDFVATRFMAKRQLAGGRLGWLEVGWAETGWSGRGAQRIYTFDSTTMAWAFYDGYRLGDGDQVWVYLHSDRGGQWQAWLWWAEQWHLLASPANLALGQRAQLEQYVEVHVDREGPGAPIPVPPIRVDRVQVQAAPGARLARWRADTVATVPQLSSGPYCLTWENRFDTWSAGDCAATVQE